MSETNQSQGLPQSMDTPQPEPPVSGQEEAPAGSPFQGVARHTLIYGLGIILGRAVSFLMLPIYTRYLTPADYGVIALIEMTLDFIAIIAGGTLAAGIFRFYHKANTATEKEEVVSTSFLMISAMYVAVGIGSFFAAVPLSSFVFDSVDNTTLFRIASANLTLGGLSIVPLAFARVRDRSTVFVASNLARTLIALSCNILFVVVLRMGVMGVLISTFIASSLVGLVLTFWLLRSVRIVWSPVAARSLLRYGVPLVATTMATFVLTFSDRFFLKAAADEAAVGLYNLGYLFGFILVLVGFTPLYLVWGPRRFQAASAPNRDEVLARGFIIVNVLLISIAVGISLFVQDFLRVMSAPEFHSAYKIVPIILLAYIFQSWASIQDIGILVSERTKYVATADFVAATVAVLGYIFLIPRYLGWGAAIATLAAFFVRYLLTFTFSQYLWPVRYRWRPVVVLVAWGLAVAVTGHLLPQMQVVASISLRSVLALIFLAGVWWFPILSKEDRYAAIGLARSIHRTIRAKGKGVVR